MAHPVTASSYMPGYLVHNGVVTKALLHRCKQEALKSHWLNLKVGKKQTRTKHFIDTFLFS